MRSIGEMARDSGLGVSALRFYDRAGVLVPTWVDPVSGYRWYGPEQLDEARLLARLRRAGMPLADVRLVLAGWSSADPDLVRHLLRDHLRRLELGLSDARSEFSTIRALLESREKTMTKHHDVARLAVSAPDLAAALDAVRFAAGTDPLLPMLGGVLFDIEGDTLHLVASDRHRLAVARAAATGHDGPRVQILVPSPLADAMRALLSEDVFAQLTVDGDRVLLETGERQAAGKLLDHDFPDYRRLVRLPAGRRVGFDARALRQAVESGPIRASEPAEQGEASSDLSVLRVAADGKVTVVGPEDAGADGQSQIAVNRGYLLDALAAGAQDQLILEFSTPTAPLAIRRTGSEDTFSILMPVRLDG